MSTVEQMYAVVNDIASQVLGEKAVSVTSTSGLVSLGKSILSSDTNKDAFYKSLCDRMGATAIAVRNYESKNRAVKKNDMEWGIAYQKISFIHKNAVENPSWTPDASSNPFDVVASSKAVQTIFSSLGTWSYEDAIPDYQLFTAFTGPSPMSAFIDGVYTNMYNSMKIDDDNLANLAVATNIAGIIYKAQPAQKRNLLKEYNTTATTKLTNANALTSLDFLKYATREIKLVVDNIQAPSYMYHVNPTEGNIMRFTPKDKLVVEILGQFASAADSYLQADTYHNEMVALPNYETVNYWQGSGTSFAFDDVSKISIKNLDIDSTAASSFGTVTRGGIIGFVHDYDSCSSIVTRRRDHSIYNPRNETYEVFMKADKGYMADLSENGVVFYIDADEA